MSYLILSAQARKDRAEWEAVQDRCYCHLSPPCHYCLHPGHPLNQEGNDDCWIKLGGPVTQSRNKREGRYGGRIAANHDLHGRKFKMERRHFRGLDHTAFGGGL